MSSKTKSEKRAESILRKKREHLIGKVFETNRCGLCTVVGYDGCEKEDGYLRKDKHGRVYHLDKDLISKGSKMYSPDTCCFVPLEINNLFICSDRKSKYATGVQYSKDKCKFVANCNRNGKNIHVGYFDTVEQAYKAYSGFKEDYIKTMAEKWKDSISKKAYEALLRWEAVDIESEVIKK